MKKLLRLLIVIFILGCVAGVAVNRMEVSDKEVIDSTCASYGLDRHLVYALIKTESGFDKSAVSPRGAVGLMQIMDDTAVWCAEKMGDASKAESISEPEVNIEVGCYYLKYLLERYNGSVTSALAAYNAGAMNVDEWLKNTVFSDDGINIKKCPFKETDMYLKKIAAYEKIYRFLYND